MPFDLPPGAPRVPPPIGSLAHTLAQLRSADLAAIAEAAIDELDSRDGDIDDEDGDEDRCSAHDDNPVDSYVQRGNDYGAGDPDDAEDEHDAEAVNEDGTEFMYPTPPVYGDDQSLGPINAVAAHRSHMLAAAGRTDTKHQVRA